MKYGKLVPKNKWPDDTDTVVLEIWTKDGLYTKHDDKFLHRLDGPALILTYKHYWFINGDIYYHKYEFQKAANLSDEGITMLVLKYGSI